MGRDYVAGLVSGIGLSMSAVGRSHRQKFDAAKIGNYVSIQLALWRNLLRLFE